SLDSASATTASEYLRQNWPDSDTGILEAICRCGKAVEDPKKDLDCDIVVRKRPKQTIVSVRGTTSFILNVVEQLSWIASALRASPSEGLAQCSPFFSHLEAFPSREASKEDTLASYGFYDIYGRISFDVKEIDPESSKLQNGTCWHGLFRNPVVVQGYPHVNKGSPGLNIPFNIMAGLLRTVRVTKFDGRIFIKGFSALLFPTKYDHGTITWHLLYNIDGAYISYLDERIMHLQDDDAKQISMADLTWTNHVVGWCSDAKSYTGSLDAHYPISRSACDESRPGWIFEKLTLSGGQYINLGLSFSVGVKDKPLHLWYRPTYEQQVLRFSKKFVLLYDIGDRRGWLVNGASALLHLVISSWKYELSTAIGDRFLSKVEDLKLTGRRYMASSAIEILINRENMALPVLPGKRTFVADRSAPSGQFGVRETDEAVVTFSDRVEEAIDYLEKAFTYQEERMYRPGLEVSLSAWTEPLAGFDFAEISEAETSIPCRFTELGPRSKGWMAFVQKLRAVTLFGRDFGDLIAPDTPPCRSWAHVPTGEDYIAIHAQDMNEITKRDPHALHGFLWYKPEALLDCICAQGDVCDRAQALVPLKIWKRLSKKTFNNASFNGKENGAIVLGYKR
ncbi:hypothetical protein HDK64DRAFT_321344, partial [Phyllosticta capitalensis]